MIFHSNQAYNVYVGFRSIGCQEKILISIYFDALIILIEHEKYDIKSRNNLFQKRRKIEKIAKNNDKN